MHQNMEWNVPKLNHHRYWHNQTISSFKNQLLSCSTEVKFSLTELQKHPTLLFLKPDGLSGYPWTWGYHGNSPWLRHPLCRPQSNPVQIRYDHHTEEPNPLRLYHRNRDRVTNSQLQKLSPDADPPNNSKEVYKTPHDACRPNVCLFSARKNKRKRRKRGTRERKGKWCQIQPKSCWVTSEMLEYTFNAVIRFQGRRLLLIGALTFRRITFMMTF